MNENIQLNIAKLQTYFEELEKRIKSVERQMTTQNQVSAIQSCLAEIKDVLLEYQSTYSELVSEYNTHKQDYDQKVSTNTTEHSKFASSISTLNANVLTLQNNVQDLRTKLSALENSSGTGSGCLCGNTSDFCHNYINCYMYDSQFYSPNFVLLANPSQYIDIKLKVKTKSSQSVESSNYTITLDLNGENVVSNSYTYTTETETKELNFRYYPTKNSNTIRFFITGSRILFLCDYTIEVNGRDVMLDAEMPAINIRCFDDKYYIVKWDNDSGTIYYAVQNKANLSLSEQDLQTDYITTTTNYAFRNLWLAPPLITSQTYTYSTEYPQNMKLILENQKQYSEYQELEYDESLSTFKRSSIAGLDINRLSISVGIFGRLNLIYAVTTKKAEARVRDAGIYFHIVNDGTNEKFYNACAIQYNYAKIGEAVQSFAGAIFQRSDGMWIYYPTWEDKSTDNTTRTEIAVGNNCSAYLQTDGSINIYIGVGLKVYKYKMTKNSAGNYELCSTYDVITGVTKYEELLDGKALAYTYDKYKIVDM